MHTYVYMCTYICVSVCVYVCMALLLFPLPTRKAARQRPRGDGGTKSQVGKHRLPKTPGMPGESQAPSSLISKSVAVRNGNEFSRVPFFWNSLCTQWELNKYLMMVLNLGSQQLFPALTLRAPWNRSGGEQPRGVFSLSARPSCDSKSSCSHSPLHTSCFGEASSSSTISIWLFPTRHLSQIYGATTLH